MSNLELQDPDKIEVKFACLRARQPIGDIFIAVIPHKDLARMTYFDVRRVLEGERDFEKYLGIQRPVEAKRLEQLKTYVNLLDASFPSSIIVSFSEDYVFFDKKDRTMTVRNFKVGEKKSSIPLAQVGRVIDGQHRIASLASFHGENFDLSVTIFIGADIADQAHIFATVNLEQTKVNRSLVYDLYELAQSRSPQKTCHNVVIALDRDSASPFHRRIKRLGLATEGRVFEPITQATLVDGLMRYISQDPRVDRDKLLRHRPLEKALGDELEKRPFRNLFVEGEDIKITQIIYNYFDAVRTRWLTAWATQASGQMLNRTNGVRALLRFFQQAYLQVARPGDVVSSSRFLGKIFGEIAINDEDFNVENFLPGTSGESKLLKIFQKQEEIGSTLI